MLVKECKKIDSKGRLTIPKSVLKMAGLEGAEIWFDITKSGSLVLRKVNKGETTNPSSLELDSIKS